MPSLSTYNLTGVPLIVDMGYLFTAAAAKLSHCSPLQRREKQSRKGKIYAFEYRLQRIARRDKKAFLSDQCKEIEENNRMGKARDLFKKIRNNKGIFHAKMGSKKDRNGRDLTEAKDIQKRW